MAPASVLGPPCQLIHSHNAEPFEPELIEAMSEAFDAACETAISVSLADFGKLIADETAKWTKLVKFAGIRWISIPARGHFRPSCTIAADRSLPPDSFRAGRPPTVNKGRLPTYPKSWRRGLVLLSMPEARRVSRTR
jgi:hypothetical protein